jgi:hypothetical protein
MSLKILKKNISITTLIIFSLLFQQVYLINTCLKLVRETSDENTLIEELGKNMHELKSETNQCIETLLRSGNFKSLEYFLNELNKRNIKFRETLSVAINNVQKKLEDLHNKFRFDESDFQLVVPAVQWAQSMHHVYLEIKFAHRHDSPGCLEVKNEQVDIHKDLIVFTAYCVLGDVPIKFHLALQLWQEVATEESTYGFGSVGRYHVTLKKRVGGMYWDKLIKEGQEKPQNMKVWFEMREKFIDQIQQYIDDDEEEEFKRETDAIEKQAKERKKNKKTKKQRREEREELEKVEKEREEKESRPLEEL